MTNDTVSAKVAAVAPTNAFINRDEPRTRVIAAVSVPDGPLITAAIDYARRLSEPYLFNHAMRSWLFAELIGRTKGIDYDREVVAVGTILHDIGLTAGVSGPKRFEVNGADAALAFIAGRGLSDRRAQLLWDLIALNSTPSLALHKEAEVAVGTMGIGVDYGGFGLEQILRWRIERDYQELKGELGLDHFEGRTWAGFHHHVALCAAAHAFLARRRALFPPEPPCVDARRRASSPPTALAHASAPLPAVSATDRQHASPARPVAH